MNHLAKIPGIIIFLISLTVCHYSCKDIATLPVVTTTDVTGTTPTSATSGGNITNDGNAEVISRGVCWNTSEDPTTANSKTSDGTGTGEYTSSLTLLTPATTYYVKAYATNSEGTAYGNQVSFNTKIADVDGNTYNTVKIGTQVWMAENLTTTKYRNGDLIDTTSNVIQDISAEVSPKYQWEYNGYPKLGEEYGRLYTWYATTDSREVCPTGFHMPSDAEWTVLKDFLGGEPVAGAKLKETGTAHWIAPNTTSTNETGFTAIPGGYRSDLGEYYGMGSISYLWSTTPHSPGFMWGQEMRDNTISIVSGSYKPNNGMYVRCLKN